MTGLGDGENHEEGNDRISAFMSHTSNLSIAVRPLSSGRSSTVTGNICFLWNDPEDGQIQHFQFRVEEKDVKVFAIGTSGAVLWPNKVSLTITIIWIFTLKKSQVDTDRITF